MKIFYSYNVLYTYIEFKPIRPAKHKMAIILLYIGGAIKPKLNSNSAATFNFKSFISFL